MRFATLRRSVALVASAALLASLAAASLGASAAAGTPKCFGKPATIVGTASGEVILGTSGPDVIVARGGHDKIFGKGGNDTICGNSGNDRIYGGLGSDLLLGQTGDDQLFGNAGPDRLLGGPDNDSLNGGIGVDLCKQGSGMGLRVNCERPAPPGPPPAIDLTNVLAIAYADLNKNHKPDAGDVMIAQLVDTDVSGHATVGDTVEMGMYPTALQPVWPADFEAWGVKSHKVVGIKDLGSNAIEVAINPPPTPTGYLTFYRQPTTAGNGFIGDGLEERDASPPFWASRIFDQPSTQRDAIDVSKLSPSIPPSPIQEAAVGKGDDYFIDVEIYVTFT